MASGRSEKDRSRGQRPAEFRKLQVWPECSFNSTSRQYVIIRVQSMQSFVGLYQ